MKNLIVLATLAGGIALSAGPADAYPRCRPGSHWSHGRCLRDHAYRPSYTYGYFYPGRGYWDGHRFWAHHGRHPDATGQIVIRFY